MNFSEERKLINLNSEFADIYNNGDFLSNIQFQTLGLLTEDPNIAYCTIAVRNAQLPVSFYTINMNNNVLYYNILTVDYFITIPEGNYDAFQLIDELKRQFLLNTHTFTITFNSIDGYLSFSNSTNNFIFLGISPIKKF